MNPFDSDPVILTPSAAVSLPDLPTPLAPPWLDRLCQRWVLSALQPMPRGRLRMVLPDGASRAFGQGMGGPDAEIQVRSSRFFRRCALQGDIGFGESFQEQEWTSPDPAAVIGWFCANGDNAPAMSGSARKGRFGLLGFLNRWRHRLRRNSLRGSRANIHAHYDLGNAFYSLWLDPTMTYSAALFEAPDQALESAQRAKYDRLCRLLRLRPQDHVLEIGSGWGGFAEHAATQYGCRITAITISTEQERFTRERLARAGVSDRARVELRDYRTLTGQYDHLCSIEMLEAVGDEYLETYFAQVHRLLKPRGCFAAQFITCPDSRYAEMRRGVDWIQKHIFPGSLLLSLNRVGQAAQRTSNLWLRDLHDLGADYAQTLQQWRTRFNARLDEVRTLGFDERFIRTWNYYLAYCEAAFAWRNVSVVQAVWSRPGRPAAPAE